MTHVAISASWKIEDLNLLLEILKLNFKGPITTHVFLNTSVLTAQKCGFALRRDLVDHLVWVPDAGCYPGNKSRDTKRRQPLDLFLKLMYIMRDYREGFVFLEGDCFPLSEKHFLEPFKRLESVDMVANRFDFTRVDPSQYENIEHREVLETTKSQTHKMPDGYVYPGGMYFSSAAADELVDAIKGLYGELLNGQRNFEGMLGTAVKHSQVSCENLSDVFCYTYPRTNQLDPVTRIIHQHNIMNLRDVFLEYGISEGEWVNKVLKEDSYVRAADDEKISRNDIPVEFCTLAIEGQND